MAPIAGWLACASGVIALAAIVYGVGHVQQIDAHVLFRMASADDPSRQVVANAFAHTGDPLPLILLLAVACGVALQRGRPLGALTAAIVVAGANLTTQVLKVVLEHPRYQSVFEGHAPMANAFPSGHVTAAASIAIAFTFVVPRRWLPWTAAIGAAYVFAVGVSVVMLAWHYPSDVVGGILVAAGWGFAALAFRRLATPPPLASGSA